MKDVSVGLSLVTLGTGTLHVCISYKGRPISKKSSQRIIMRGNRRIIIYSKAYSELLNSVVPRLKSLWEDRRGQEVFGTKEKPVRVKATFWAGKGVEPDLSGALETVGDVLQAAGIIENDRWIKSWDWSRMICTHDDDEACTWIDITPFTEGTYE
jgi:hypothetical protein